MRENDHIAQLLPANGQYIVYDDDGLMALAPVAFYARMESGDVLAMQMDWDGTLTDPTECVNFVAIVPHRRDCETAWDDHRDRQRAKRGKGD